MSPIRKYNGQNWLPSLFNDFFDNEWMGKVNATAPAINVIESDADYKVEVAAPGMTKEDFYHSFGRRRRTGYLDGEKERGERGRQEEQTLFAS